MAATMKGELVADAADDKLYCICKTSYDEDRVMIACDRCVSVSLVPLLLAFTRRFACGALCC